MSIVYIFLVIIFVLLLVVIWALLRKKPETKNEDSMGLKLILEQINELNRTVDSKISESSKHMNESVRNQFNESAKLIKDVTQGLTKLDETNRQVV